MNKQIIEIQQEETEQIIKVLERARNKLNTKQELNEFDLPIQDRKEFINILNAFIENKLSIAYSLQEEYNQGKTFYEERVYSYERDFELMPVTKEEERNLNDKLTLTKEEENYLENENEERYYNNKYGEEY